MIATSVHGELATIWLSVDPDSEPIDVPVTELFVVGEWTVPTDDTARLTLPGSV